jgi:hypothetical protein
MLMQYLPMILVITVPVLWFASGVWIARDADKRGKPGGLVALLALVLCWPISLLVWIALRPEERPPARPPFDLNRYRQQ